MLDAESQRRELQGVAPCPSRITPTSCQFLSNPFAFNLLNRFSVTRTQVCFRQIPPPPLTVRTLQDETCGWFMTPARGSTESREGGDYIGAVVKH